MSDDLNNIGNENVPEEKQENDFDKRRRLLKASAAVPFVATLTSGAAQAATSAITCEIHEKFSKRKFDINGQNCEISPPGGSISGLNTYDCGDGAVRVRVKVYHEKSKPNKKGNRYYEINGKLYSRKYKELTSSTTPSLQYVLDNYNQSYAYVLLIHRNNGAVIGEVGPWPMEGTKITGNDYFPSEGENQPLYQSCLTSITTTNINSIKGNIV